MRALLAVLLIAACGGSPKPAPAPPRPAPVAPVSTELSPALAPLSWWLGDWKGELGTEHWVAAAGAIYGVVLNDKGDFEVMIVDDAEGSGPADGVLRLFAMPGGKHSVTFTQSEHAAASATFANKDHDDVRTISYERTAEGLKAVLASASGTHITFPFTPIAHAAAPELEAADLAFAAATKTSGADGWLAAFAPTGWMWRKTGVVEHAQIAETMQPLLASGTLAWAPIASGANGGLGYTVGKATFTGATPADGWKSTYVTIWQRQPDGRWQVLFDTGRGVNEP
jgi:hypothetical protein